MKISKAIALAAVAASLLAQMPANASGNAHKYPVVVPSEPVVKKPAEPVVAKPAEAVSPKQSDAAAPKASDPVVSKPSDAASAKPAEKSGQQFIIVSRFEPLSGRDSLEAVPDLNRGRGRGK